MGDLEKLRQNTRQCAVGRKPRLFFHANWCYIIYNTPGLLCVFFLFLWWGVQTLSTVWVNKNQVCDFPLDEDTSSYFHTFPRIPILTSQTETSTRGRKNIKIRECPMVSRRTWWKHMQMLWKSAHILYQKSVIWYGDPGHAVPIYSFIVHIQIDHMYRKYYW